MRLQVQWQLCGARDIAASLKLARHRCRAAHNSDRSLAADIGSALFFVSFICRQNGLPAAGQIARRSANASQQSSSKNMFPTRRRSTGERQHAHVCIASKCQRRSDGRACGHLLPNRCKPTHEASVCCQKQKLSTRLRWILRDPRLDQSTTGVMYTVEGDFSHGRGYHQGSSITPGFGDAGVCGRIYIRRRPETSDARGVPSSRQDAATRSSSSGPPCRRRQRQRP